MSKYSIIIPTYNRCNLLQRLINFYESFEEKINIIIADSSLDENKLTNRTYLTKKGFKNHIKYLDHYSSNLDFLDKIYDAIKHVKSKYVVLCADDDFILPNGIIKSINYLENNKEYLMAHGKYFGFWNEFQNSKKYTHFLQLYKRTSIDQTYPLNRLKFHFYSYGFSKFGFPTFYGVHRSKIIKSFIKITKNSTTDMRFGELLLTFLTVIYGKVKTLNITYGLRQTYETKSSGSTFNRLHNYIEDDSFNDKFFNFKKAIILHSNNSFKFTEVKLDKTINHLMYQYLKRTIPLGKRSTKVKNLLKILKENNCILSEIQLNLDLKRAKYFFIMLKYITLIKIFGFNIYDDYRESNTIYLKHKKDINRAIQFI